MSSQIPSVFIYNSDSFQPQYFTIPNSIISYISNYPSSAKGYLKLQKTCKYFFSKKRIVVSEENIWLFENQITVGSYYGNLIELPLDNFSYWLTKTLVIRNNSQLFFQKFYRLDLKEVYIRKQDLTLNEFNFLASCKNLISFAFLNGKIKDKNTLPVEINYILSKLPNISTFIYGNSCETYSNEKLEIMNSMIFKQKFEFFALTIAYLGDEIDPHLFWLFMKKNIAPNATFSIRFHLFTREIYKSKLFESLKEERLNWNPPNEKPDIALQFLN